jgi:hypothetical protein
MEWPLPVSGDPSRLGKEFRLAPGASEDKQRQICLISYIGKVGYSGMYWIDEALCGVQRMMRTRSDGIVELYEV